MEDKKVKAGSVAVGICLFIIAILLVVIVFVFYNLRTVKNNLQSEVNELKTLLEEKEDSETEKENKKNELNEKKNVTIQQIAEIASYIEKIYPKPGFDKGIPKFEQIRKANEEWIWSVVLKNAGNEINADAVIIEDAEKEATKLFGKDVGEFPGKSEELHIEKVDNGFYWSGDQASIPDVTKYVIKNVVAKENIYEAEIIEYLVHNWADGIWIGNLEGEKIKTIIENEEEFTNYQIINSEIKEYVENNTEKFDSKVLTIEYNKNEGVYRIISIK